MRRRYDLVVIGGGTAGLVAAMGAAGVGARVCLVEHHRVGGDCLWTGCVPSKSLLAAADLAHRMRTAECVGLVPVEPEIELGRVLARVGEAQQRLAEHDSEERLAAAGVEVIRGTARFRGPRAVDVDGRTVEFRRAVIATGSRPVLPAVHALRAAKPLTTDTVWALEALPSRLLVLGAGPVGCELAQAFARLGSSVTLVEMRTQLLPQEEPETGALLADRLTSEGVDVRVGARGLAVERAGDAHRLRVAVPGGEEDIGFDRILVAAGRRADTGELRPAAAGIELRDDGSVSVDTLLRTSNRSVFAAGDVTGAPPFTHVAAYHGRLVVTNALFRLRRPADHSTVPWVTFTDPEVGRVGLTEAQARGRYGAGVVTASFEYDQLDRAVVAGRDYGFAKLVADPRQRLVGATVAAVAGGETIAELASWVDRGGRLRDVSQRVRAYPTFAEGPKRAADEHLRARIFSRPTRRVTRPLLLAQRWLDR